MAVSNANYKKKKEIDEKINQLIQEKEAEIYRPVTAFITFESQEGFERACEIKSKKGFCFKTLESENQFLN